MAVNDNFVQMTGYGREELLAQTLFCLFHPQELSYASSLFRMLLARVPAEADHPGCVLDGLAKGDVFGERKPLLFLLHLSLASIERLDRPSHISVCCLVPRNAPSALNTDEVGEPL